MSNSPFSMSPVGSSADTALIKTLLSASLERISGLKALEAHYQAVLPADNALIFLDRVLNRFNVGLKLDADELINIPKTGPCVIVANHPFGAIEGLLLARLLCRLRPDVKIMANYFLQRIPEISALFIGVDPFGGKNAARKNLSPTREALRWVHNGGLLVIFPAGEVAHLSLPKCKIREPKWLQGVGKIIQLTKAPVVPVYIHGHNSWTFQLLGLLHARLRTLWLPRELLNKKNKQIEFRIGKPIFTRTLESIAKEQDLSRYLRLRTLALARQSGNGTVKAGDNEPQEDSDQDRNEAVGPSTTRVLLQAEISQLEEQCLGHSGSLKVYYARAGQIPWMLREIGRQREITFRAVGEGTGKDIDLDVYDTYYHHLFIWNEDKRELVGAYRMGLSEEILTRFGSKGFYTHSLFKYRSQFIQRIQPAIELGRSFVRQEYQKSFTPLLLLWKGISQFVVQNPQYSILFGPVSISNNYEDISKHLLVDYLKLTNFNSELGKHIKPRNPLKNLRGKPWNNQDLRDIRSLDSISDVVAQLEEDHKGVPVLLRQYLKLGGTMLGFNVDPDFQQALDGLILVDLKLTDPKTLQKYMGAGGIDSFLAYHAQDFPQAS